MMVEPWGPRPHATLREMWALHRLVVRLKLAVLAMRIARRLNAFADGVRKEANERADEGG